MQAQELSSGTKQSSMVLKYDSISKNEPAIYNPMVLNLLSTFSLGCAKCCRYDFIKNDSS